jgi:hypothetical protein
MTASQYEPLMFWRSEGTSYMLVKVKRAQEAH